MMKDFRYHVVSLVAVFLALAVGVVLGSGPMRDALLGDMSDQVAQLEQERSLAQSEAESARALTSTARQFAQEAVPSLLAGTLAQVSVGTIAAADAAVEDATSVRDRLVEAGATVAAEVRLEPAWTDPDQAAFRSSLASTMAPNIVGVDDESSTPTVLAHALAQALMPGVLPPGATEDDLADTDFPDPANAADRSALLFDLLRDAGLVSGSAGDGVQALAVIVGPGPDDENVRAGLSSAIAAAATIFAEYTTGVTVASGPDHTGDVASVVQNSPDASAAVSTVVGGTDFYGQITVPLALAEALSGTVGHYGPGEDRPLLPSFER